MAWMTGRHTLKVQQQAAIDGRVAARETAEAERALALETRQEERRRRQAGMRLERVEAVYHDLAKGLDRIRSSFLRPPSPSRVMASASSS